MSKQFQKGSQYSDRIVEFLIQKGPPPDFWFFTAVISFLLLVGWFILKLAGVINTPLWLVLFPYAVGVATIVSTGLYCLERAIHLGGLIIKFDMRLGAVETGLIKVNQNISELHDDIRELRTDYQAHLIKYHA